MMSLRKAKNALKLDIVTFIILAVIMFLVENAFVIGTIALVLMIIAIDAGFASVYIKELEKFEKENNLK